MPQSESPHHTEQIKTFLAEDVRALLSQINGNIRLETTDSDASELISTRREGGNRFTVSLNTALLNEESKDSCVIQVISSIDALSSEANLQRKSENQKDLEIRDKYSQNPSYDLLYKSISQNVALHRANIPPVYFDRFKKLSSTSLEKIKEKFDPVPSHIQFLLGMTDLEVQDEEVIETIEELKMGNILNSIVDPRKSDEEKLRLINTQILPQYEYFLRKDKKDWRPSPYAKASEDRREKEDFVQPKSPEQLDKSEPHPQQLEDEPPQSTPDYQSRYSTQSGGTFEKDPLGKGYKIEIFPTLDGLYWADHKSYFDQNRKEWENISQLTVYDKNPKFEGKKYSMKGYFEGRKLKSIPLPLGYALNIESLKFTGDKPNIYRDQNGAFYLQVDGQCEITIDFYKQSDFSHSDPIREDTKRCHHSPLSGSSESVLQSARSISDNREKARMIRDHIRAKHFYPPGKNRKETANNAMKVQNDLKAHATDGNAFILALDNASHLECFSANCLMVAMMRDLGVPARMVTGHNVEGKNKDGNSEINSGNGHGWCVIWDGTSWVRFDATPVQDPNDPANKKDSKDNEEEADQSNQTPADKADDGGGEASESSSDDSDESGEKGESQNGRNEENEGNERNENNEENGEGFSDDSAADDSDSDNDSDAGEQKSEKPEDTESLQDWENFDSEKAFQEMYEELKKNMADKPTEEQVQEAVEQLDQENRISEYRDPDVIEMAQKFPGLSAERIEELAKFIKEFREAVKKISQIKNPDYVDGISENETLEDELKSILDRVISRSIVEKTVPHYPVSDGDNLELIDPVQLYLDREAGRTESYVFLERENIEEEELRVVKVRRRKVLDGSSSMKYENGAKLRTQQEIEVLENKVTAEKQVELNELADQLNRDIQLETETWQFGVEDEETGKKFARLKSLSDTFDEREQNAIWKLTERAVDSTNDFDPLESIHTLLTDENERDRRIAGEPTVLERIRLGFLIREMNAYEDMRERELELNEEEQTHFDNLRSTDPDVISKNLGQIMDENHLSHEEGQFFENHDTNGRPLVEIMEDWHDIILDKYGHNVEPILEVVEITSDGDSNDETKLKKAISALRKLGVIVTAYGLGNDGKKVTNVYANSFNPMEGGHYCQNLIDYPRNKAKAWHNILDRV